MPQHLSFSGGRQGETFILEGGIYFCFSCHMAFINLAVGEVFIDGHIRIIINISHRSTMHLYIYMDTV